MKKAVSTLSSSQPPNTLRLRLRHALRHATASEMVQWATAAMVAGWDTPALRVLAGLDVGQLPSIWETAPYFDRALVELGTQEAELALLAREYVAEIAHAIVEARIGPREAVEMIHGSVVSPLDHPSDLQGWCDLNDGLDPRTRAPIGDQGVDARILVFAQEWRASSRASGSGSAA
jgi:hypothetical protein